MKHGSIKLNGKMVEYHIAPNKMLWPKANNYVQGLNGKWSLPTKHEFEMLCANKKEIALWQKMIKESPVFNDVLVADLDNDSRVVEIWGKDRSTPVDKGGDFFDGHVSFKTWIPALSERKDFHLWTIAIQAGS